MICGKASNFATLSNNDVDLLDAPKDSFIDVGIICKHICLIFGMVETF